MFQALLALFLTVPAFSAEPRVIALLAQPAAPRPGIELHWSFAGGRGGRVVLERDGERLGETADLSFLDDAVLPGPHVYRVRGSGGEARSVKILVRGQCSAPPKLTLRASSEAAEAVDGELVRVGLSGAASAAPGCEPAAAGFSVGGVEGPLELVGGRFEAVVSVRPRGGGPLRAEAWAENAAGRGSAEASLAPAKSMPSAEPFSEEQGAWRVWRVDGWFP